MAHMCRAHTTKSIAAAADRSYHGPDLISSLPNELLHRVLTFLTTPETIRTSVLSRRWIDVWTRVPRLVVLDHIPSIELMNGVLRRYAADVDITDLTIWYHYDFPEVDEAQATAWAEFAAQRVTGRFSLSVETQYRIPDEFIELPCFKRTMEISLYSVGMVVLFPPPVADVGGDDKFTRLTKLQMSELRFSDNGEGISDVVSQRCPRLEILELERSGELDVISLTLRSESLLILRIVSLSRLRRLEVEAGNLRDVQVEDSFAESYSADAIPTAMRLSTPALEVFRWGDRYPDEFDLTTLPMFLKELFFRAFAHHIVEMMEYFSRVDVLKLNPILLCALGSEELESLIHRVQLPYYSDLDLGMIANGHMSFGPFVIHILKRNSSIRNLTLTHIDYYPEPMFNGHCIPDCTCRKPLKWWHQERITLDYLEQLAINISGEHEERQLIYYIMRNSKVLKKESGATYKGPHHISSLAHGLLHQILVFLPVVEVIRPCVLSHCWIHILKLLDIYSGMRELIIRSTSLLTLLLLSISDLLRLEVDAAILTSMQVYLCAFRMQ
uniref:F-box domain-containing protein n=1 Tax=Leersia perrieri TaxID=77586 RepID=A0A0D9X021_9ORYZ